MLENVTNATVSTNTTYDSSFWVKITVVSQDTATNKSKIEWSCGVNCGHNFYSNAIRMSAVTIDGVEVYKGGTYSNFTKGTHTIASGTMEVQHNDDGTKDLTIGPFTGWLYSNHNYSFDGYTFGIKAILRQATITEANDFTDQENPSIKFVNPLKCKMDVWLESNLDGEHLCVREGISDTGEYTWTLTTEERDLLRSKCSGKECPIRYTICSHIGDKQYFSHKDKKFTLVESFYTAPSIDMEITLDNGLAANSLKDTYIQGKTRVNVKIAITPKFGAEVQSYTAKVDGKEYPNNLEFTSDVIQNAGSVVIECTATDSRGFSKKYSQTVTVAEYSKPLLIPLAGENAIRCYRSDSAGNKDSKSSSVWVKTKRHYSKIDGKNKCAIQWRRKPENAEWNDDWYTLLPRTYTTDDFNSLIWDYEDETKLIYFDPKKSYTVQLRAIDYVGEFDIKTFDVPTENVALHLGRGGTRVSIGTYCQSEEYTFYSDWDAIFDKNVYVGGDIYIGETSLRDYILGIINEGG